MIKNTFIILIIFGLISCKQQQQTATASSESQEPEKLFTLSTTPCFGPCPVFNLALYSDSTLMFEGKQHTDLQGVHNRKLSAAEYDAFIGLLKMVKWENMNPRYVSDMTDLPSQEFYYNFDGVEKNVYKYGLEPQSLANLSQALLAYVNESIFTEEK